MSNRFQASGEGKRHVPFIQDWLHGRCIQLEHLCGRLLSILGLDDSCPICLPFRKGRQWLVDDQLLRDCVETI